MVPGRLIDAERGLREQHQLLLRPEIQRIHVRLMFDQMHVHGVLPHHADRLIMPPMADVDDLVAFAHETQYFTMHLADQRAGGIHDVHAATCGLRLDLRRHAVRREHDRDAGGSSLVRYLRELLHEHGPLRGEILDDMPVVHDLTTHIHRAGRPSTRADAAFRMVCTVRIARSTPAQNPRGSASTMRFAISSSSCSQWPPCGITQSQRLSVAKARARVRPEHPYACDTGT